MAAFTYRLRMFMMMYPMLGATALAGSLADIEHVVLFMQGMLQFWVLMSTNTEYFDRE
jgi:hypothetical protein